VKKLAADDWARVHDSVLEHGHAIVAGLCSAGDCRSLAAMWNRRELFRKHVVMARHAFGVGEYAYFADPLPTEIAALREGFYGGLVETANTMMERLGRDLRFPSRLDAYLADCAAAGQTKPTPLLLRYRAGGYNRLHRDLYGERLFPLQATILLSRPHVDFDGGQFLLLENSARMQARAQVIELERGDAVVFPTAETAVEGVRGWRRAQLRHGVSTVHRGTRMAAGIIFHNAA